MTKILVDKAVLEQALESLNSFEQNYGDLWQTLKTAEQLDAVASELRAALEQPVEQEPVAWANINKHGDITHTSNKKMAWAKTPIYTHPQPPRQPLTDDEIERLWYQSWGGALPFARAIERAHGIGGEA